MIEPLVVEPSRLETAGNTLRDLVLPVPPSPIATAGTDSVSAAINETLPIIESSVSDGLPTIKAALTRTGSSIAAAAGMYADTDQRLGDHLTQVQFLTAGEKPGGGASADQPAGAPADEPVDKPSDGEKPSPPKPTPQPGTSMPQLGQMAGAAGMLGSVMQGMQGAMGSMPGSGAAPAQLAADSNKTDPSPADQDQLVDETETTDEEEKQPEALAEGAAPGTETLESIPVPPPTFGRPEASASEINL